MKFEKTEVFNFEGAVRGMRNPLNSWGKSDSYYCSKENCSNECKGHFDPNNEPVCKQKDGYIIGQNDLELIQRLIKGGEEHRKFMRQIFVSVDITAPLYWWKEFDTYKVGTVSNSCSTMHKLASTPIALDCFELNDFNNITYPISAQREELKYNIDEDFVQMCLIPYLEYLRTSYIDTEDKTYWKELVRWLPSGYLQKRTITMNYENVLNMVRQRSNHKLTEWKESFINWAKTLPYAEELIFYKGESKVE